MSRKYLVQKLGIKVLGTAGGTGSGPGLQDPKDQFVGRATATASVRMVGNQDIKSKNTLL